MPVTVDMSVLDNLRTLGPAGVAGIDRAVKTTGRQGRTIIIEEVAAAYKVPRQIVARDIRVPSGAALLTAEIKLKGDRLPMYGFGPQPNMPFMGGRREPGVSVDITTRRMVRQSVMHPGQYAFIARMASGHLGVFQRTGTANGGRIPRLKAPIALGNRTVLKRNKNLEHISEMFTLSVSQMEQAKKVEPRVNARLQDQLRANAEKEYGKAVKAIFKEWAGA